MFWCVLFCQAVCHRFFCLLFCFFGEGERTYFSVKIFFSCDDVFFAAFRRPVPRLHVKTSSPSCTMTATTWSRCHGDFKASQS